MTSVERVLDLCRGHGVPVYVLEKKLGFSNAYLSRLKKGLPYDRAKKIADFFNVSVDYILTGEEKTGPVLTEQEKRLLENFRALSENGKRIIEETSKALSDVSGNVHSA